MEPDAQRMALGDRGDRLSALPEELALNIIGRLPTKSVVAVVVCVKKWYDAGLWRQVEDLDFNQDLVFGEDPIDENTFCSFVGRVLSFLAVPVRRFKLGAYNDIEPDVIAGWISEAVRLGAVEIQLDSSETVRLPESLLLSTTVHTLRLDSHVSIPLALPENMFTGLHTLRMQNHFDDMDFLGANLFRRIPSLHELYLDGSVLEDASVTIQIVLPQLERLELSLVSHGDADAEMGECRVILDTPRLMYVSLYSDFEVSFEVVDSPIVVTAQLRLGVCARGRQVFVDEEYGAEEDRDIEEEEGYAWSVFNLLSRLRNVQTLSLSAPTRCALSIAAAFGQTLPMFPNLTQLELGISYCCGWLFPSTVFRDSPILERIVISSDVYHGAWGGGGNWLPPTSLPNLLEEVQILGFDRYGDVEQLVEHLVTNANGLKRLVFGSCGLSVEQEELLRGSLAGRGCEVQVTR